MVERLKLVGLPADTLRRYPHELSGGQRQRVGVARALCLDPTLIVADEPVSALDVSIQAQVLNLLVDLKAKLHMTCIFISHDLRVIRYISDRIVVLYLGRVVELASHDELFAHQLHPYTQALLAAVVEHPSDTSKTTRVPRGEPPNPADVPPGCPYHTRCPFAQPICSQVRPELAEVHPGHWAACHFAAQF
jgi:oligopeptide/dipeptide ABC transporter ATP-binding protein